MGGQNNIQIDQQQKINTTPHEPTTAPLKDTVLSKTVDDNVWKNVVSILLLVFLTPIGVIVIWFITKWPRWLKITITLLFVIPYAVLIFFLTKIGSDAVKTGQITAQDTRIIADIEGWRAALNSVVFENRQNSQKEYPSCPNGQKQCRLNELETLKKYHITFTDFTYRPIENNYQIDFVLINTHQINDYQNRETVYYQGANCAMFNQILKGACQAVESPIEVKKAVEILQEEMPPASPSQSGQGILILDNYQNLVLNQSEMQSKFSFLQLDEKESGEIRSASELDFGFKENDFAGGIKIEPRGGYKHLFKVNLESVIAQGGNIFAVLGDYLLIFNSYQEAQDYLASFKKSAEKPSVEIIDLNDLGEIAMQINIEPGKEELFSFIVFKIKNTVNVLSIFGSKMQMTEADIIELAQKQANKVESYQTSPVPNPLTDYSADEDKDGLKNYLEERYGTAINNSDTDGDGYSDGGEVTKGYNPVGQDKIIDEEIIKQITDKKFLRSLYFVTAKKIGLGIFEQDRQYYYVVENNSFDKVYFSHQGTLKIVCLGMSLNQTADEKKLCQDLGDINNFEPLSMRTLIGINSE